MNLRMAITFTAGIGSGCVMFLTAAGCCFSPAKAKEHRSPDAAVLAEYEHAVLAKDEHPAVLVKQDPIPATHRLPPVVGPLPTRKSDAFLQPAQYTRGEPVVPVSVAPAESGDIRGTSLPEPRSIVSDSFIQTDVQQVIISLANQAGVSVVLDERVTGVTSATFEDEPFDSALRKVLLPLGYVYRYRDGQYLIGVPDSKSALFPLIAQRYDYHARHRSAEELIATLPHWNREFVRTSGKRQTVIIDAPPETADRILSDLSRSDEPAPQVVLEAVICVYSPEHRHHFGFDLSQELTLGGNAMQLGVTGLVLSGNHHPGSLNHLTDFRVTSAFLRALEQRGLITIRAAPRVMAQSGEKAQISIGRETYFSVQPLDSSLLIRQDIEQVEAGISLDITPVVRDSHVTVQIERAEVSEDIRSHETRTSGTGNFPIINRRRVSTTVEIADGHTIVIGGLRQRQEVDQVNKIPILGSLPYIGWLFQRVDRQDQESEVAVFLTTRIVRGNAHEEFVPDILPHSIISQVPENLSEAMAP